ncbi:MAG TPA: protein kinase [Kofleriaceae bacterium]|nr:protein kinase [Kofleriaceae bacterium]
MLDDKYRIERLLATGGMGSVYLGTHIGLRKRVAIKVVNPLLNSAMIARFHREAVTASQIGHEGIAQVTDIGTSSDSPSRYSMTRNGSPSLVMEYLEGESLADRLRATSRLPIEDACELGCAILSPLAAAHRAGIVHRDLKPDNVFLVRQSRGEIVKLLDFGISRAPDRESDFRLTTTGLVLGTPYYMSPEQARGESVVTPAADLYAFGVILYEMLCGEVPIRAENYNALMYRVSIGDYVPPCVLRPELPERLEHVMMWAMARTAEERPVSAGELEQALLPFCRQVFRDHASGQIAAARPPLRMPPVTSLRPTVDTSQPAADTPGAGSGPTSPDIVAPGTPPGVRAAESGPHRAEATDLDLRRALAGDRGSQPALIAAESDASSSLPAAPARSRRVAIGVALAVAAAVLCGAAAIALTWPDRPSSAAVAPPPRPVAAPVAVPVAAIEPPAPAIEPPAPAPAAAAPERITVTLAVDPASAAITLDGAAVGGGELSVPRDGALHRLRITAAGYLGYDETLVFDQSQRLVVALKRAAAPPRPRPRKDHSLDGIESQSPYR